MQIPFPLSTYDGKVVRRKTANEIWVNGSELPTNIARNILATILRHGSAYVAVIGSGAINQVIKGIAVAREMSREKIPDVDLYTVPYFSTIIDQHDRERTRIVFVVIPITDVVINVARSVHQQTAQPRKSISPIP